jgi:hypothetical protein
MLQSQRPPVPVDVDPASLLQIERLRAFDAGQSLGGLSWRDRRD